MYYTIFYTSHTMLRSVVLTVLAGTMLTACNFNSGVDTHEPVIEKKVISAEHQSERVGLNTAKAGEACGVLIDRLCGVGLECIYQGAQNGTCQPKELDQNFSCSKKSAPVCGQKDRRLLSYLNECEALRHKATIVGEGFCEQLSIATDCNAKVLSIGNCGTRFVGFEYQDDAGCAEVAVNGCEAVLPFENSEACISVCGS